MKITKEFTVVEHEGFRLRVKKFNCLKPDNLYNLDFIQETLDEEGNVLYTSTYNFFLTNEEIQTLAKGLVS